MRVNRFPGKCTFCDGPVAANAGMLLGEKGWWSVAHTVCATSGESEVITIHFPSTGNTVIQNRAGKCIDAGCCGCCS